MFGIGMTELIVIFVIGLLVLGPKRLPEMARSLGRSMAEFRRASSDLRREFTQTVEEARIDPVKLGENAPPQAGVEPDELRPAESGDPPPPTDG